jgi:uncharacterized protein (DUF433 family)
VVPLPAAAVWVSILQDWKERDYMAREYIEEREGGLYVAGSRVSLASIITGFQQGNSPETIRQIYPTLSLAQVYGTIAFYLNHPEESETYMTRLQEKWDALERSAHAPSLAMQERLDRARQRLVTSRE